MESERRDRAFPLAVVALVDAAVIVLVLLGAWWPTDSPSLPLDDAIALVFLAGATGLVPAVIVGLAVTMERPAHRAVVTAVGLVVAGLVGLVFGAIAAIARIDEGHEA